MFKVLKTLLVQIHDSYKDSLILPPSFVLDDSQALDAYINNPDRYLNNIDKDKVFQAMKWLVSEADFEFTDIDLSGKPEIFGWSDFCILEAQNLKKLRSLNITSCQIEKIPKLESLGDLESLLIADNNLTDVSTSKHENLKHLDVKGKPY